MLRSTIFRAFYLCIVFLANLLLANILLPSYFGNISLLIVNAAVLSLITGFGSEGILLYYSSNKKWDTLFAVSFAWIMLALQVFFYFFIQLGWYLLSSKTLLSQNSGDYLVVDFLYFLGLIFTEKYIALFYSSHKEIIINKLLLIFGFLYLCVLFIFQHFSEPSFFSLIAFIAIYNLLQGVILATVFHFILQNFFLKRIQRKELFKILRLSGIIMITNVIQTLAYRIDFLFVKYFHSDYEVGIYAQANKFANLLWVVPNIIAMLLIPKFSGIEKEKMPIIFRGGLLLNLAVCCITIAFSNLLYYFFLAPQYKVGLPALYLMIPGYVCWATVLFYSAYISWRGHFLYNLIASSFCFVTIFVCDFLLIPKYSIEGAAISNTLAYSLTFVLYITMFKKLQPCETNLLFKPKRGDFYFLKNLFK